MPYIWKTEYAIAVDGEEEAWEDELDAAMEKARELSKQNPDADVTVTQLDHYQTERTEVGSFSDGIEEQEEG